MRALFPTPMRVAVLMLVAVAVRHSTAAAALASGVGGRGEADWAQPEGRPASAGALHGGAASAAPLLRGANESAGSRRASAWGATWGSTTEQQGTSGVPSSWQRLSLGGRGGSSMCGVYDRDLPDGGEPPLFAEVPPVSVPPRRQAEAIVSFDEYKKSIQSVVEQSKRKEREGASREAAAPGEQPVLEALGSPDAGAGAVSAAPPDEPVDAVNATHEAAAEPEAVAASASGADVMLPGSQPTEPSTASDADAVSAIPAVPPMSTQLPGSPEAEAPPPPPSVSVATVHGVLVQPDPASGSSSARFNYASARFGAKVLASNKEGHNAKAALSDDADAYYITPCTAPDKWLAVELSEEVLMDSVQLTNVEFYSAPLREWDLYVSRTYPKGDGTWTPLARLVALPERGTQSFSLPHPAWARFLVLAGRSHHGEARYCTLTQLAVHGKDAAETLREEMALAEVEVGEVAHALRASGGGDAAAAGAPVADAMPGDGVASGTQDEAHGQPSPVVEAPAAAQPAAPLAPSVAADVLDAAAPDAPAVIGGTSASTQVADAGAGATPPEQVDAAPEASAGAARVAAPPPPGGQDNIFKTLVHKLKALELNVSVLDAYMMDINSRYVDNLRQLDAEVSALQQAAVNASVAVGALAARMTAVEGRAFSDAAQAQAAAQAELLREVRALQADMQRAAAREVALGCMVAVFVAVLLLQRGEAGPPAPGDGRPAWRAVLALRRACAALALANGAIGALMHFAT